ncbi:MAG: hypothetical protein PVG48_02840 [Candidatus Bathyarchaeota archaeon]|jgi:hypothetical protein
MILFGKTLSEVECRLFDNIKKTKSIFPEETQRIEFGLVLMRDLTQCTQDAVNDYKAKPNLFANHNLFARNRQLLLNAYYCLLCSSYGTQFVILRTVLENNNLMRLFNKNPQYAFEWLSEEKQKRFSKETQLKYGKSHIANRTFKADFVRKHVFNEIGKKKVRIEIAKFHAQLSNYNHPNSKGWQELVGKRGEIEIILNMPRFLLNNTEKTVGITLYLTQLSFKTFVETFKDYVGGFADQLKEWQDSYNKLIVKYKD